MNPWLRYGFIFIFVVLLYAVFDWSMGAGNTRTMSAALATAVVIVAAIIAHWLDRRFGNNDDA
ncbi:MAG TPA: hypothetical protein VIS04_01080 [Woeseiaceae bacterium]